MNAKDSKILSLFCFHRKLGYTWTKSSTYMEGSKEEIRRAKWEAQQGHQSARQHPIRPHKNSYVRSYEVPIRTVSSNPTTIIKGPAPESDHDITDRRTDLHLRHQEHPQTLAAAIFHLHSHSHHHHHHHVAFIPKLATPCNRVSHPATIVRHIINQSFLLMCSSMVSSCDLIAMCE